MKMRILNTIYTTFAAWAAQFDFACARGCAVCCTGEVALTGIEAELLLDHILNRYGASWLAEKLSGAPCHRPPSLTTNEFARACLEGRAAADDAQRGAGRCPFVENSLCLVYPARPFACRCFASTAVCRPGGSARLPGPYLSAATAVTQIIEHLGQFHPCGNLTDVLLVRVAQSGCLEGADTDLRLAAARANCRPAQPLPGFLFDESEAALVSPLLRQIFSARLGDRTVEEILNGRHADA